MGGTGINVLYMMYAILFCTLLIAGYFTYNWLKCMLSGKKTRELVDDSDSDDIEMDGNTRHHDD